MHQFMNEIAQLKAFIAVASIFTLVFSEGAISAKAPSKPESSQEMSLQKKVMSDGYFANNQCGIYIQQLALPEQGVLKSISRVFLAEDNLIYMTGGESTAAGDFEALFRSSNHTQNPELLEAKKKLSTGQGYISEYSSTLFSKQKIKDAITARDAIRGNYAKNSEQRNNVDRFVYCKVAENILGLGEDANIFKEYLAYSDARVTSAEIGYFKISADSSRYSKSVKTGNRFAEPKQWNGSRFFVIQASFKNLDTESRLPVEGSLLINYNGKDYEFDSVEPIMLEGYNIWFKKVNPLITMKTKIVYRIPDEIHGEVFWRPGRNPNDTKLWLGYISAAKSN